MASTCFSDFSNENKWKEFFALHPKFTAIVSIFVHGDTLSHGYVNDMFKNIDRLDLFVDGELLTDEAIAMMLNFYHGLGKEVIKKLDSRVFNEGRQALLVAQFGSLFDVYLKGFAMTEKIAENKTELHVLVTSPSLRKQGIGRRLMNRIKGQGGYLFANASDCQSLDQFRELLFFLCLLFFL